MKKLFFMVLSIAFTIFLSGCEQDPIPKREKVTIQLDWKPGAEHAFLYYGKKEGFFKKRGIDLQIVPGKGSSLSANMIDAKNVLFALCSGETAIQARSAKSARKLSILAVFYPNTPATIYSLAEKGIDSPEKLYGKKLGVIKGSSAGRVYEAFAKKANLDRTKINEIDSGGDVQEIIAPNAPLDAMVHFSFQHPLSLGLAGYNINEVPLKEKLKIYGQSLIVHPDMIEKREDLVRRTTAAVQESYRATILNPDLAMDAFLKQNPEQDRDYAVAKLKWVNEFVKSGIQDGEPVGNHDTAGWEQTRAFLHDQGLLELDVPLSSFITTRYLDKGITL